MAKLAALLHRWYDSATAPFQSSALSLSHFEMMASEMSLFFSVWIMGLLNKAARNDSVGVTNRSFGGHNGSRQAMAELTEVIYSAT